MDRVKIHVLLLYNNPMVWTLRDFPPLMLPKIIALNTQNYRLPSDFRSNFANYLCDLITFVDGFRPRENWQP